MPPALTIAAQLLFVMFFDRLAPLLRRRRRRVIFSGRHFHVEYLAASRRTPPPPRNGHVMADCIWRIESDERRDITRIQRFSPSQDDISWSHANPMCARGICTEHDALPQSQTGLARYLKGPESMLSLSRLTGAHSLGTEASRFCSMFFSRNMTTIHLPAHLPARR